MYACTTSAWAVFAASVTTTLLSKGLKSLKILGVFGLNVGIFSRALSNTVLDWGYLSVGKLAAMLKLPLSLIYWNNPLTSSSVTLSTLFRISVLE